MNMVLMGAWKAFAPSLKFIWITYVFVKCSLSTFSAKSFRYYIFATEFFFPIPLSKNSIKTKKDKNVWVLKKEYNDDQCAYCKCVVNMFLLNQPNFSPNPITSSKNKKQQQRKYEKLQLNMMRKLAHNKMCFYSVLCFIECNVYHYIYSR